MSKKTRGKKDAKDFAFIEPSNHTKLLVTVTAKNAGQKKALRAISENQVTFLYGTAGTGKSHCAVGWGVQEMLKGHYDKLVFTRPYVEAGEKMGFLPGGADDKFAPFVMPLYEIVGDYLSVTDIKELVEKKKIVIYPFAYMRGVTFKKSYVVADECQNSTIQQMRMILTRLGEGSKLVCTGDTEQSDLGSRMNGLSDAISKLQGIANLEFVELGYESCVREKIVSEIDKRYRDSSSTYKTRESIIKNSVETSNNNHSIESEKYD